MIELNCTNCKELLQIDDAFAGGVCRCRHCGTIQTVPKRLKQSSADQTTKSEAAGGSGTQVLQKQSVAPSGTGLDDLAGIVASSGLRSARLQKNIEPGAKSSKAAPQKDGPKDNKTVIILSAAGGVIALLIGIIVFMATREKGDGNQASTNGTGPGTVTNTNTGTPNKTINQNPKPPVVGTGNPVVTPAKTRGPAFLGQSLNEKSIAYVLDRGSASEAEHRLDLLKTALINSVKSLGPDRRFAVIFWQIDGGKMEAFPEHGLADANEQSITQLASFLDGIYSVGQTKAPASTEKAFHTGAEAVVIVPIKTFIEPGTHTAIVKSRGNSSAKTYCFTLAQADIGESFQKVAKDTNGSYRDVSMDELKAAAAGE